MQVVVAAVPPVVIAKPNPVIPKVGLQPSDFVCCYDVLSLCQVITVPVVQPPTPPLPPVVITVPSPAAKLSPVVTPPPAVVVPEWKLGMRFGKLTDALGTYVGEICCVL